MPIRVLLRAGLLEYTVQFLLKLEFKTATKAVAFADDLMLALRGDSLSAVELLERGNE
jgi:hypothetical protein